MVERASPRAQLKTPKRAWQKMLSGRRLDLLDPTPMDIEIEDIAHGLSFVARWNGQTIGEHPYSVAEHSLLVAQIYARLAPRHEPLWELAALLHDAPEYVIGDMISPVKAEVGPGYAALEERLTAAIHLRFGLPAALPARIKARIKKADKLSAWAEATELAGFTRREADQYFGKPDHLLLKEVSLHLRSPSETRAAFLAHHHHLIVQL